MGGVKLITQWTDSFKKEQCSNEELYIITMIPFNQQRFFLKSFNDTIIKLPAGQHRISMQYISKEQKLDITIESNDSSLTDYLTYGKFTYFELTNDGDIKPGNKEEFEKLFKIRKQNSNKEKNAYWNTYWKLLHTMSLHYPLNPTLKHKEDIQKLIKKMALNGIPCNRCLKHFIKYKDIHNISSYYTSQKGLFEYFVDLHNDVNKRNRKTLFSYDEAYNIYKNTDVFFKDTFDVDILHLVKTNLIHTIPLLMNGKIRMILKRKFNLL